MNEEQYEHEQPQDDYKLEQQTTGGYLGGMSEEQSNLMRFLLDPYSDLLLNMEHFLKGDRLIEGKWLPKGKAYAILNEKGIGSILSTLQIHCSKISMSSNLSNYEIATIMESLHKTLAADLFLNYKEYGVDLKNLDMLVENITSAIYYALKRSQGGTMLQLLGRTQKIIESTNQQRTKRKLLPF